jgi:hypothetical protein
MNGAKRNRLIALLICAIAASVGTGVRLHRKGQAPTRSWITQAPGQHSIVADPLPKLVAQDTEVPDGQGTKPGNELKVSDKPVDCIVHSNGRHTANQYLGAAAGEHDLEGGMGCPIRVNDAGPTFMLHFVGRPNNTLGDIEVQQAGKVIQTITGHEVDLGALYPAGLDVEVRAIDANFDGYQDLELLNDCGATGNCDYDFYLYDPTENKFVFNKFLSGLTSPSFDAVKKRVVTMWNTSAADWGSSTYEFRNGRYVEIEREESSKFGTVTSELRDGRMVLVKSEENDGQ